MKPSRLTQVVLLLLTAQLLAWIIYTNKQKHSPGSPASPRIYSGSTIPSDFFDPSGLGKEELKERILSSSVVALAEHAIDGKNISSSFKEIIKKDDGVQFPHEIGDGFGHIYPRVRENYSVPDGAVAFYEGSPARFSTSLSIYEGKLPGALNISVTEFKKLVEEAGTGQPATDHEPKSESERGDKSQPELDGRSR